MTPLTYIEQTFGVDVTKTDRIDLHISRWKEFPVMLREIGVKTMVEIGTYKGDYAGALKQHIPDLDLTCVDAWTVYKGYKDYGENDLECLAYEKVQERAKQFGFSLLKAWSLDAVKHFKDESLDAVFIDGNHDFRHVVEDVDEWSRKVKKGGIVSGHDFFKFHRKNFGVYEAIPAWCEANDIPRFFVVSADKCPSWFYIK